MLQTTIFGTVKCWDSTGHVTSVKFIAAEWRVGNLTITDSNNGLSPGRHQAIIWTNGRILLIVYLGTSFGDFIFYGNTFESVVCEKADILSRPRCVNDHSLQFWQRLAGGLVTNVNRRQYTDENICLLLLEDSAYTHLIDFVWPMNVESGTKFPPFRRRHFQMHFLE